MELQVTRMDSKFSTQEEMIRVSDGEFFVYWPASLYEALAEHNVVQYAFVHAKANTARKARVNETSQD